MAHYDYAVTAFPNDAVALSKLSDQIEGSAISSAALDHINVYEDGNLCEIYFDGDLSAGDQTTLDGLVAAHDGVPYPNVQEQYFTSDGESETTSTKWTDKMSEMTDEIGPGTYKLEWSAEVMTSHNGAQCSVRIMIDDQVVSDGGCLCGVWGLVAGFEKLTLTGLSARSLKFQFKGPGAIGEKQQQVLVSAKVRRVRVRMTLE